MASKARMNYRVDYAVDPRPTKLVDRKGNETSLTSQQKNSMYRHAKNLREEIRVSLLTHAEHWKPTPENIKKLQQREAHPEMQKKIQEYKNYMKAIGAESRDISLESMRRVK